MQSVFHQDSRTAQLTVVCGIGPFGRQVLDLIEDHLTVLPEAVQCATACARFGSMAAIAGQVEQLRSSLATDETTRRIEAYGWQRDGLKLGVMRVRHLFVLSLDEQPLDQIQEAFGTEQVGEPGDVCMGLFFISQPAEHLPALRDAPLPLRKMVVSGRRSTGEYVADEAVQSSVAGMVLAALLPEVRFDAQRDMALATFGFSGLYGMTGPALRRLSEQVAHAILDEHLRPLQLDETSDIPASVEAFLARYSPRALGTALFDPTRQPEVRPERIPADPVWGKGDALAVQLDEADVALDLPKHRKETWTSLLRDHARVFDMTISYKWRLQLEAASKTLITEIRQNVATEFAHLLQTLPYAPAYALHILEVLDQRIRSPRTPLDHPDESQRHLDAAFDGLDAAVKQRPNAIALGLRLALWVVPALVAGALVLNGLYEDVRGWFFPLLYVLIGAGAGLGWYVWRLKRSHERIIQARDRAVNLIVTRQEAILSENAIGYLAEVVAALQEVLAVEARPAYAAYRGWLHKARAALAEAMAPPLDVPLTFQPVLSTPEAFEAAFDTLQLDRAAWLTVAVREGVVDPERRQEEEGSLLLERVVGWSRQRLMAGDDLQKLDYETLWRIRTGVPAVAEERQTEALDQVIEELWRLSAPLIDYTYAPSPNQQDHQVLAPSDLVTRLERLGKAQKLFRQEDLREIHHVPLLCFLRTGTLTNL